MTTWYLARAAGLAALILLTTTTAVGAAMSGAGDSRHRVVAGYLHRVTASLGLAALALHLTTILADPYAHVGWLGALVPFTSGYRPTWVGLGTLAIATLLLVGAFGFARGRFAASERAARTWRAVHCLAYVGWALAMAHGFFAGSDSDTVWVRLIYLVCGAAVLGALASRLTSTRPLRRTSAIDVRTVREEAMAR